LAGAPRETPVDEGPDKVPPVPASRFFNRQGPMVRMHACKRL